MQYQAKGFKSQKLICDDDVILNKDDNEDMKDDDNNNDLTQRTKRQNNNILSLIDSFIEQIFHMRRTLNFISISAIILASFAMVLSIFLLRHPSFFAIENRK